MKIKSFKILEKDKHSIHINVDHLDLYIRNELPSSKIENKFIELKYWKEGFSRYDGQLNISEPEPITPKPPTKKRTVSTGFFGLGSEEQTYVDYEDKEYLKQRKKYDKEWQKHHELHEKYYNKFKYTRFFYYENEIYMVEGANNLDINEMELHLKAYIYKNNNKIEKLKKEIELIEKAVKNTERSREPISEEVKFEVWRRDQGKCIKCSSQENLEFDHIIPFSKGGSNSARNIQLLCEKCNREKSNKI